MVWRMSNITIYNLERKRNASHSQINAVDL